MLFKKIGLFAIIVISLVISVVFPLQAQDQIWTNSTPIVQDAGAGPGGVFPTQNYNSTNYWVDVIFVPNPAISCPPPPHSAVLAWQAPSGVTQFNVYQNGVKITPSPISATTYTVSGLTAGSVLTFSVTSILNGSESSPSVLPTLTVPSP